MNVAVPARSNSSLDRRNHLKKNFVDVPAVSNKVSYRNYVKYARTQYFTAVDAFNKGNFEVAYIAFQKTVTILFTRLPQHPDYKYVQRSTTDQANEVKLFVSQAQKSSIHFLEQIAAKLDEEEDCKIKHRDEFDLIDAFDCTEEDAATATTAATTAATTTTAAANLQPSEHDFSVLQFGLHSTCPPAAVVGTTAAAVVAPTSVLASQGTWDSNHLSILDSALYPPVFTTTTTATNANAAMMDTTVIVPSSLDQGSDEELAPGAATAAAAAAEGPALAAAAMFRELRSASIALLSANDRAILHYIGDYTNFYIPPPATSLVQVQVGSSTYVFNQDDFHVSFSGFLSHLPIELQMTDAATETNRCFFIHLGIALKVHPFALQSAFRMFASAESRYVEDWVKDIISTMHATAGFVDANALNFLWPEEFNSYRICFISGSLTAPIIACFTPHQSIVAAARAAQQPLTDIVIRCNGAHFTLLQPFTANASAATDGAFRVIDALLADATAAGLVVQVSSAQLRDCRNFDSSTDAAVALVAGSSSWERSIHQALSIAMSPAY